MIDQWVGRRLGEYDFASDGSDIRVNCPFCSHRYGTGDVKKHLYVSMVKPQAHCFRCDWSGNYISLIMSVDGCSYYVALQSIENVPPNVSKFETLFSPRGLINDVHSPYPSGFMALGPLYKGCPKEQRAVTRYLRRRIKTEKDIVDNWGWVPGSNRAWVLVDRLWWQGRVLGNGEPKYLSPPWPIGDSLWNSSALLKYDEIDVCEGVFSAYAAGPQAVALCSKNLVKEQSERIVASGVNKIRILFDSDAHDYAHSAADMLLSCGYNGRLKIHYLHTGDPADSLDGYTIAYGWDSRIRYTLSKV